MESSPEPKPETILGRLRKFMATLKNPDTLEMLEDTIATIECLQYRPRIVPERRLSSTRVCRQHFLQWDPQVFMLGLIWQSVSFPPDRDVTDSDVYLRCNQAYTGGSRADTGGARRRLGRRRGPGTRPQCIQNRTRDGLVSCTLYSVQSKKTFEKSCEEKFVMKSTLCDDRIEPATLIRVN